MLPASKTERGIQQPHAIKLRVKTVRYIKPRKFDESRGHEVAAVLTRAPLRLKEANSLETAIRSRFIQFWTIWTTNVTLSNYIVPEGRFNTSS